MKKIIPLHDRVIIKPIVIDSKTKGGIIIPDSAKEKPIKGEVIACGGGKNNEPLTVKEGDIVLYNKYAGSDIDVYGTLCIIMKESDILAII